MRSGPPATLVRLRFLWRLGPWLALLFCGLGMTGCKSVLGARAEAMAESRAVAPKANVAFTTGESASTSTTPRRGESPIRISEVAHMHDGMEAFTARVALARFAQQSLDMQYYIWDGDQTGSFLLSELIAAADRGVRVRLLLDDITSRGIVDGMLQQLAAAARAATADLEDTLAEITPDDLERKDRIRDLMDEIHTGGRDLIAAALDTHPNIEVRMFNPFNSRKRGGMGRAFQFLADFSRLNRRMHNKVFAADNQIAIVGGRNIADNYFGLHEKYDFRDLDLMVRGPVVQDVSESFDLYWNSEWAVPVHTFSMKHRSEQRLAGLRKELAEAFQWEKHPRLKELEGDAETTKALHRITARMVKAPVRVVADLPGKVQKPMGEPLVAEALAAQARGSEKEILVESAYFVPVNVTFENMHERIDHGVHVCILTNSLASTNQMPAYAGYAKHRKRLLETGVSLYELRPYDSGTVATNGKQRGPRTVLHTKAVVFDREQVFVGTFNLDPRSADLNTEIGLMVNHPKLAGEVAGLIESGMKPDRSWRLSLGKPDQKEKEHMKTRGPVCWCGDNMEKHTVLRREPETRWGSRFLMRLVSWLPIDEML
ncbi:phospholipase D family protein [Roseimicrobium sp. ORNL1]|uniref:phospholipase D family protein n=1 Tax=Roseimicrobium sp. ORNL1 TaxID=2711231 RepID=UPI0013E11EE8|nr:phospholipase D family protein [Roseimicrobium sp. ORNL1]QIF00524.1 phospholipase D family protein [Roseimicrobium sp. ORNL1]